MRLFVTVNLQLSAPTVHHCHAYMCEVPMAGKSAIFFDVGGVLMTDGWDHVSRKLATEKFGLDWQEFETEHAKYADALDTGNLSVADYLDRVVFCKPCSFSKNEFFEFMKNESVPNQDSLRLVAELAKEGKHFLGTLNNESTDLNLYRIEKFQLYKYFTVFLSSCFLGVKKPDKLIYERALQITHSKPEETIFIDDREANLVPPRELGMTTIQFKSADQVRRDLQAITS